MTNSELLCVSNATKPCAAVASGLQTLPRLPSLKSEAKWSKHILSTSALVWSSHWLDECLMCWVCQTTKIIRWHSGSMLHWIGPAKKTRISNAKRNANDRRKLEAAGSNMWTWMDWLYNYDQPNLDCCYDPDSVLMQIKGLVGWLVACVGCRIGWLNPGWFADVCCNDGYVIYVLQ